jgi:putative hydrolase of HD superfamily
MKYICEELLKPISESVAKEFMELWQEYEVGETKEAIFVKDGIFPPPTHFDRPSNDNAITVDRFELVCQTIEYEKQYEAQKDLQEFLHVRKGIKNEFVKKWVEDALLERDAFWQSKGLESKVE